MQGNRHLIASALAFAIGAVVLPGPAFADISVMTRGYTYFNKAGADLAAHDAAVVECVQVAARARTFLSRMESTPDRQPMQVGLVGGLIWGSRFATGHRGTAMATLENCMVVKGWRIVKLPDREGRALARTSRSELVAALAPWIGSETPRGDIVREWRNEAASSASRRFTELPPVTDDGQLGLKAATGADATQFMSMIEVYPGPVPDYDLIRPSAVSGVLAVSADSGVILLSMKGNNVPNGFGLVFQSETGGRTHSVWIGVGEPDFQQNKVMAIPVPAGRWRLAAMRSNSNQVLDFCWGAPSFEVPPGKFVWAGRFDLASANLRPDLDLEPALAWLTDPTDRSVLVPAEYLNGSTAPCDGTTHYALEF
jgi:hypothetical protein